MKKHFFLISLTFLWLLSCNNTEQKQTERIPKTPVEIITAPDSITTLMAAAQDTTVNADTVNPPPQQVIKPQPLKTAGKKKSDKKEPPPNKKTKSDMATENTPQKIIGNEYFEVTGGYYCNDDWSNSNYSPGCTNCRFCREVMVSVIYEDTIYFKQMWMGGYIKNITAHTAKGGRGGLGGCVGYGPESQKSPSPIPYQGQALISYTVGNPNAEIQYFDVTNLINRCGGFYPRRPITPLYHPPHKNKK